MKGCFAAGEAVGCLGSHVQAPAASTVPCPPILTAVQASTTPTVMVTAELALLHAYKSRPGSSVLVHAGTGGVGLAAVQASLHITYDARVDPTS